MNKYYTTFGQTHKHPKTGVLLKDYWVTIEATSEEIANRIVRQEFGDKYFAVYTESELKFTGKEYFPLGEYGVITEIVKTPMSLDQLFEKSLKEENGEVCKIDHGNKR